MNAGKERRIRLEFHLSSVWHRKAAAEPVPAGTLPFIDIGSNTFATATHTYHRKSAPSRSHSPSIRPSVVFTTASFPSRCLLGRPTTKASFCSVQTIVGHYFRCIFAIVEHPNVANFSLSNMPIPFCFTFIGRIVTDRVIMALSGGQDVECMSLCILWGLGIITERRSGVVL
jgi:hypothetical protein